MSQTNNGGLGTSRRISLDHHFEDSVFYKAQCACTSDNDTQTLILEREFENLPHHITLAIHANYHFSVWYKSWSWYERLWVKIKKALQVLFLGHLEVDHYFVFDGKEQIQDYIKALQEGIDYVEKSRE